MERTQCLYENEVKFNLSESGVSPLEEKPVLITPGAHFGIGNDLRIGFGYDIAHIKKGLRRIDPILDELRVKKAARA